MTADAVAALATLVEDVCASDDLDAFTSRWGRAGPSPARTGGVRVLCHPACPFEALEVRPWAADVTGVVDVELRPGGPPLAWAAVRDRLGPFRDLPRRHPSAPNYGASVAGRPGQPAGAFLILTVEGDAVVDLSVRRDPR